MTNTSPNPTLTQVDPTTDPLQSSYFQTILEQQDEAPESEPTFVNTKFKDSTFYEYDFDGTNLINCHFQNSAFHRCTFNTMIMSGCTFKDSWIITDMWDERLYIDKYVGTVLIVEEYGMYGHVHCFDLTFNRKLFCYGSKFYVQDGDKNELTAEQFFTECYPHGNTGKTIGTAISALNEMK